MLLQPGTYVVSTYDTKLRGTIVGYGVVNWPDRTGSMRAVYLVQVAEGSSALGPACRVCDVERVVELKDG